MHRTIKFKFFQRNCMDKRLNHLIENCQIFSKSFKNIDKHRPLKNKNPGLRYHFLSKKAKQSWNYKGLPGPIFSTYLFWVQHLRTATALNLEWPFFVTLETIKIALKIKMNSLPAYLFDWSWICGWALLVWDKLPFSGCSTRTSCCRCGLSNAAL